MVLSLLLNSHFKATEPDFKICLECNSFLSDIHQFATKAKLIDAMLAEIETVEQLHDPSQLDNQIENLNIVRQKYGLDLLETPAEQLSSLFDESNITGALEIKLESDICDFEAALSEEQNEEQHLSESSEEEDEDESEIEQLSDSHYRKHEESLQFQGESSDSDGEQRKRRKKKYRKSDEEKLFE